MWNYITQLEIILQKNADEYAPVISFDLNASNVVVFDFTHNNTQLLPEIVADIEQFTRYVFQTLEENKIPVGIGKYNEDRTIYARSGLFGAAEVARTIHLAIDLWSYQGTSIFAPLVGKVHSFKDNAGLGDYGPTIILEHMLDGVQFYTLYGHLSRESLVGLYAERTFKKGEKIGEIGSVRVNGAWPPHVHFQVIETMGDKQGDFPGVASKSECAHYLSLCPNPNYILGIKKLH